MIITGTPEFPNLVRSGHRYAFRIRTSPNRIRKGTRNLCKACSADRSTNAVCRICCTGTPCWVQPTQLRPSEVRHRRETRCTASHPTIPRDSRYMLTGGYKFSFQVLSRLKRRIARLSAYLTFFLPRSELLADLVVSATYPIYARTYRHATESSHLYNESHDAISRI